MKLNSKTEPTYQVNIMMLLLSKSTKPNLIEKELCLMIAFTLSQYILTKTVTTHIQHILSFRSINPFHFVVIHTYILQLTANICRHNHLIT